MRNRIWAALVPLGLLVGSPAAIACTNDGICHFFNSINYPCAVDPSSIDRIAADSFRVTIGNGVSFPTAAGSCLIALGTPQSSPIREIRKLSVIELESGEAFKAFEGFRKSAKTAQSFAHLLRGPRTLETLQWHGQVSKANDVPGGVPIQFVLDLEVDPRTTTEEVARALRRSVIGFDKGNDDGTIAGEHLQLHFFSAHLTADNRKQRQQGSPKKARPQRKKRAD